MRSYKWDAAKCQDEQRTNTAKTCDIYLMHGQFELARYILKVKRVSYLKIIASLPQQSAARLLLFATQKRAETQTMAKSAVTAGTSKTAAIIALGLEHGYNVNMVDSSEV